VLRIARQTLAQALQRTGGDQAAVVWSLEHGRLALEVKAAGTTAQTLRVDYRGDTLRVGFNSAYWLDALNNLDCDQVEIAFGKAFEPAVLTIPGDPHFKYVVMPMVV
jgi:DNA polymerase III sliding clamp (beta) subunit (PCNA family)